MQPLIHSSSGLVLDAAQQAALGKLNELKSRLSEKSTQRWWSRLRRQSTLRGLYLVGAVGRGKTMLMDQFVAAMGSEVYRVHFHRFMKDIHERLAHASLQQEKEPLRRIALEYARSFTVLCLDDLWVSDITDAMLIGGLFQHLRDEGLVLVITSNSPPEELYPNGLQRSRFLPTIDLLRSITELVTVNGPTDYRLRALHEHSLLFIGVDADQRLTTRYNEIASHDAPLGTQVQCQGRTLHAIAQHQDSLLINFNELCRSTRSTQDYIELADRFEFIALTGLNALSDADLDPVRRFIALIDELYDRHRTLAIAAAEKPWNLYRGSRLAQEWLRTHSRLQEMLQGDKTSVF